MSSDSTPTRTCTQCGKTYPATTEYFHRLKSGKYGLHAQCKPCMCERRRLWRVKNAEYNREYQKRYREEHYDDVREYHKRRYKENLEHFQEYHKQYYIENADSIREGRRQYYAENTERVLESQKKWRKKNPDKRRASHRRRRARKYNAGGTHTAADIEAQKRGQTDKRGRLHCWWCGTIIKDNNYHVDHVIPLVKDGRNDIGNLVISCPDCNMKKHDKLPWEFNGRLI